MVEIPDGTDNPDGYMLVCRNPIHHRGSEEDR